LRGGGRSGRRGRHRAPRGGASDEGHQRENTDGGPLSSPPRERSHGSEDRPEAFRDATARDQSGRGERCPVGSPGAAATPPPPVAPNPPSGPAARLAHTRSAL